MTRLQLASNRTQVTWPCSHRLWVWVSYNKTTRHFSMSLTLYKQRQTKQCCSSSSNSYLVVKLTTTISGLRSRSLVTAKLVNRHFSMLSHRPSVLLLKMKNRPSCTSRPLTTSTMRTNTKSCTLTCQARSVTTNTFIDTRSGQQLSCLCSTLQNGQVLKKSNSGFKSAKSVTCLSKFLWATW